MKYYILKDKIPVPTESVYVWGKFFEGNRAVQQHDFGEIFVSTVFLGLDHNYYGEKPLLFETMIFPNEEFDYYQRRCSTWDEAVEGHLEALDYVVPIWKKRMNFDFILEIIVIIILSLFLLIFGLFLVVIL